MDNSDKKNIIGCRLDKNVTSSQLLTIWGNKVIDNFKLDKNIESLNKDMIDISFFYWQKCN